MRCLTLGLLRRKHEADLLGDGTEGTVGAPRDEQLTIRHGSLYVGTSCREASLKAVML